MPAWYDIYGLDKLDKEDEEGLTASRLLGILLLILLVESLIEKEIIAGIPASRIIIGGFSQGAALSLFSGLTLKYALNSLLIFSGYLPCRHHIPGPSECSAGNVPVFMAHGTADSVVQLKWAQMSLEFLREKGFSAINFKTYPMAHESCQAEMHEAIEFIQKQTTL